MKEEVLGPIMVYPFWSKIKGGLGRGRKERGFWKTCQSFDPGACFSNVRRTLQARKATCQTAIHFFFKHAFDTRKTKRIAKFDGLEPRRCEDIKGIVAPENRPLSSQGALARTWLPIAFDPQLAVDKTIFG